MSFTNKRQIMYGNPYTGVVSNDRKVIEESLKKIGMGKKIKVSHRVHKTDIIYWWMKGEGRLK